MEKTDKQMIIDMARDNLSQRSDDFKEERATILFVQKYIGSVMDHDSSKQTPPPKSIIIYPSSGY